MASDVLECLQDRSFVVYPAPRGDGERKYVYQDEVVTLQKLMSIANEHRANRRLPPFPLVPKLQ